MAIVFAGFVVAVVACAALTLDLGDAWQTERRLHTASDAAALAAADTYASGATGCPTVASYYVSANGAESMASCTAVPYDPSYSAGYVTVKAVDVLDFHFAAAFGTPSKSVMSSATVQWGPPKGANNLRPLGLCLYYPGLSSWLNLPDGPTGPSGNINVPFSNAFNGCNASSNWGWLDISGSAGGNAVNDWLDTGYPTLVPAPTTINSETGHISSVATHLATLKANGTVFPIAMFDSVAGTGSNTQYHVVAFAMAKLVDYKVTGTQSSQFFTFQFFRQAASGTCCGTGPKTGAVVTAICAVNSDPTTGQCGL